MHQVAMEKDPHHNHEHHHDHSQDEGREDFRWIAERRVRLGVILAEIGKQNNVSITNEELQRAVITEAQRYPGQEKEVFDFFKNNPQALDSIRAPLFEDKVIDLVMSKAKVAEKKVTIDELMAEDPDPQPKEGSKSGKAKSASKPKKAEDKADKDAAPKAKKPAAKKDAKSE